ncbi:hypothetical protein A6E01_19195 (plasmid) [Vibrio breoganii]|uniref:Uncharacterized protein n=1 Tax=Vibrio breoganii TaxID=553239 RepID=A0AAN0XZD1_9VIBR|nr:hypothetical protein [Vibrio breoganii]ANO35341.1 hypothetical protein A6E01_19195 [Vibrio breoganii]
MDKKQKNQAAVLGVMVSVLGYLAYDTLFDGSVDPRAQRAGLAVQNTEDSGRVLVHTVEVEKEVEPPAVMQFVGLPELSASDAELLSLSQESRLLEAKINQAKLSNELRELTGSSQRKVLPAELGGLVFNSPRNPGVESGMMPPQHPVQAIPAAPSVVDVKQEPKQGQKDDKLTTEEIESLFAHLKVTSVTSRNGASVGWIQLGERRIQAEEGMTFGGVLVKDISSTYIEFEHIDTEHSRKIFVGYTPQESKDATSSTHIESGYMPPMHY